MAKRILLIDDDDLVLDSFSMIFTGLGYEVETCVTSTLGIDRAQAADFDLILCDIRMPGLNGAEAVASIRTAKPQARIFALTAYPGDPIVQEALEAGAQGVMKKPFEIAKILELLKEA